jgi:hypothetical protein
MVRELLIQLTGCRRFRSSVSQASPNDQRIQADHDCGTKYNYIFHFVTSLFVLPKSCSAPRR